MTPTPSRRRAPALALAAASLAWGPAAAAQAAAAAAQSVTLELRPHVGDTLWMRLRQQVEMTGTMRVGVVDSTTTVVTTLQALTHAVVERRDAAGTVLATTADSVEVTSSGGHNGARAAALGARARDALQGRLVRLRVAPDGTTEVLARAGLPAELQAFFSQMPATLPRGGVAVGERWTRTMDMPAPGRREGAGAVSATFRLDSLSRGGALAHVSMRGHVTRPEAPPGPPTAMRVAGGGEIVGTIVVDRRRGWLAAARTTLLVRSTVTPPASHGGPPLQFRMRVDEWLTAVER